MLGLLGAWLLYPAVALLVCLGLGLLVERATGERLPGVLVLPLGMAGLVVVTQLPTYLDATAELTLPLVVAGAAAGLWLGLGRLRAAEPDRWAAGAFLATAGLYGAPVILTGSATILGYTILGDTTIHLIGADALLTLGRDFDSLPPSSYEYSLVAYYGANAYPSGGPTAAAALTSLVGIDVAWTFQTFLTLLSALMGQCLYVLASRLVPARPLRAAIAFLAAVPALSVAYAWQGSVKEVGTAFGVVLVAALMVPYLQHREGGARRALPLAVATGATIAIVGPAAVLWLGPMMAGAFVLARFPWRQALLFVAVAAVGSYQMLFDLITYVDISGGVVTAQQEFGNLLGPLRLRQAFGIWLTGDYRVPVTRRAALNDAFLVLVALAMLGGIAHVLRRRAWELAIFLGVSAVAFAYVVRQGSPWADGKALMIVSPAVMLAAGLGAAWLRRAGVAVLAVIALGVLWTHALQFHDASPAPRDRFAELQRVGERIDGEGPTLYPEFEEFAKHFIRQGDPEGTGEGWQRRFNISRASPQGAAIRFGFANDLDAFSREYVAYYRTIVLRKGFQSSRPPADYRRTFSGRFYEVWQRTDSPDVAEHVSAGSNRRPSAPVECTGARQRYAFVPRTPNVLFEVAKARLPRGWFVDAADAENVVVRGAGRVQGTVTVEQAGEYDVWIELSDRREWTVSVDDRRFAFDGRLNSRGVADRVGTVRLEAGEHSIAAERPGGSLAPGSGGQMRLLGPVALTPRDPGGLPVRTGSFQAACAQPVDWVETLR